MEDLKIKMYNYETTPPEGVWNSIVSELDGNEAKVIPLTMKRNKNFAYMAAASIAILLGLLFFINRFSNSENEEYVTSAFNTNNKSDSRVNNSNVIMTVPIEEKTITNKKIENAESLTQNKLNKNGSQTKSKEVSKDKASADKNLIARNATTSRYITIEGPQGQPVKVSSKMATLIDSSETKLSSKPIWNKKIDEWREIMKVNTLAPTTGNFLDIVELTKTLKDKK
jgi:cytoskeletal protein RodZ